MTTLAPTPATQAGRPHGVSPRQLARHPGFRRLFATRMASQLADGILNAALVSFVVFSPEHATTASKIAGALAVTLLPYSIVGPFVGIVIDRVSRRQALIVANGLRAAVLCGLAALIAAGHTGLDFEATALVAFSIGRFVLAALSAGLPLVVDSNELVSANSVSTTCGALVSLLGAGLGAGLRGVLGSADKHVAVVVLIAAGTYLVAAAVARSLGRREIGPAGPRTRTSLRDELGSVVSDAATGARGIWIVAPARDALGAIMVQRFAYGFSVVVTIVVYRNYFHAGLAGLGLITALGGAGAVLAALTTPRGTRRFGRGRWMIGGYLVAGTAELAFGLPFTQWSFAVAALIIGFSIQAAKICTDTIVQTSLPDELRGRAFSVYDMLFNVSYVVAAQLARWLPRDGKSELAVTFTAAGYGLAGLVYLLLRRRSRSAPPQLAAATSC